MSVGANCKAIDEVPREKPSDSRSSMRCLPNRGPSKSNAPTPINSPLPFVIRIRGVAIGGLACQNRQQCNPAQRRRKPYSRHVTFRQHHPVISRMLYQPLTYLHQNRCSSLVRNPSEMPAGKASLRYEFPRLWARMLSLSRTSLPRNRSQLSRVILTARLPSLIHCSVLRRW